MRRGGAYLQLLRSNRSFRRLWIAQLISLERRIRSVVPPGPRSYQPMVWVGIALPIFIVEGFFNLLTNVDIIIVGHFMDPDKVAVYFAAVKTLAAINSVDVDIDNDKPGLRPQYHADYYAAFVFDPDGHKIEAVRHAPE